MKKIEALINEEAKLIKKICFMAICLLIVFSSQGLAKNTEEAKKCIDEFLKAEFIGDNTFRVDNAAYSSEREMSLAANNKGLRRDVFQWENEALCVVDSYSITNIKISNMTSIINVSFDEYACACNAGYGEKQLIKAKKTHIEKYTLVYKKKRWWIKDPPKPRVSRKALIEYNEGIIKAMESWVQERGVLKQKEYYKNIINTNNMLRDER